MKITVAPRVWTASVDQNGRVKLVTAATQGPPGPPGDKATQAQAEAGTDDAAYMTPLKTAQAIDALAPGVAPVQSVAGRTGDVVVAKADVGLGNVDNTSDANKPVSTAQAAADALKVAKAGDAMTGALQFPNNGGAGYLSPVVRIPTIVTGFSFGNTTIYGVCNGFGIAAFQTSGTTRQFLLNAAAILNWSTADINGAADTGLSRGAAGQVNVGNGTAGDFSGTLKLAKVTTTDGANSLSVNQNGATVQFVGSAGTTFRLQPGGDALELRSGVVRLPNSFLGFSTSFGTAPDAALSRISGGVVGVGTGTAGDTSGTFVAATFKAGGGTGVQVGTNVVLPTASAVSWGDVDISRPAGGVVSVDTSVKGNAQGELRAASVRLSSVLFFGDYTVATVPSAAACVRGVIWVHDEATGPRLAYSDGVNWRRLSDDGIIS